MATLSNGVPEGNKAPLIRLDDNHHGSWLVICSAFGLVIILLTLIIRIYLRFRVSPPFAADDIALTVSTALAVIQCSLVFAGVHEGDGTSIDLIDEDKLVPIQKVSTLFITIHLVMKLTIQSSTTPPTYFTFSRSTPPKPASCSSSSASPQESFTRRLPGALWALHWSPVSSLYFCPLFAATLASHGFNSATQNAVLSSLNGEPLPLSTLSPRLAYSAWLFTWYGACKPPSQGNSE